MSRGFENPSPVEASTTPPNQPSALGTDTSDQIETTLGDAIVTDGISADQGDTVIDVSEAFTREKAYNARGNAGDISEGVASSAHEAQALSEGADVDAAPNGAQGTRHTGSGSKKINDAVVLGNLEDVECDMLASPVTLNDGSACQIVTTTHYRRGRQKRRCYRIEETGSRNAVQSVKTS